MTIVYVIHAGVVFDLIRKHQNVVTLVMANEASAQKESKTYLQDSFSHCREINT